MNVIKLVIAGILFLGGFALMGYAPEVSAWQAPMFFAGIVSVAASFGIPIHLFSKTS